MCPIKYLYPPSSSRFQRVIAHAAAGISTGHKLKAGTFYLFTDLVSLYLAGNRSRKFLNKINPTHAPLLGD